MCGIVGYFDNTSNKDIVIKKMMDRIIHRGPDMGDLYTDDSCGLGFRRLSIIDPVSYTHLGTVAGCYVLSGKIIRNSKVRIVRDGIIIHEGELAALKRFKDDVPAFVKAIEYDPNRTANIALICYADGEKAYILAPEGLKVGMKIMNGPNAEVRPGNCLPLADIPVGTMVHNIELHPGKGGQLVRSAGNGAQLMAKEGKYATLRLPSGEMRMVPMVCRASVGTVGNGEHSLINIGKAGRKRHMGIRPTVRGSVMNPNDHPHGGGEGRAPIGRPGPCTPWGKPAMGLKTRKKNKQSNKYIVRRRDGKTLSK